MGTPTSQKNSRMTENKILHWNQILVITLFAAAIFVFSKEQTSEIAANILGFGSFSVLAVCMVNFIEDSRKKKSWNINYFDLPKEQTWWERLLRVVEVFIVLIAVASGFAIERNAMESLNYANFDIYGFATVNAIYWGLSALLIVQIIRKVIIYIIRGPL
jgi:hypothetical protein